MSGEKCRIITIDGPAGSGKSTLARGIALTLGISCIDSGATYRALGLKAIRDGIDPSDEIRASKLAASTVIEYMVDCNQDKGLVIIVDGEDVTEHIRSTKVGAVASMISRHSWVRQRMVVLQRSLAAQLCSRILNQTYTELIVDAVVIEGRDIGTVVFPDAWIKLFLDASLDERASRRHVERDSPDSQVDELLTTKAEILKRDLSDRTRKASPLIMADDSILIDNTNWRKEETLEHVMGIIDERLEIARC